MKTNKKQIIVLMAVALAILAPYVVFLFRAPVIIVADAASIMLCGEDRIRAESARAAFALFRPVKTVTVNDDAGEDIVPFAIAEASIRPHCVLFPLRFARQARLYRELNPGIPIVVLEGRLGENSAGGTSPASSLLGGSTADYFVYKTDIDADFYGAGLAAYVLDKNSGREDSGRVVVFLESGIQRQGREAFLRALNNLENPPETVFLTSFSQFSEIPDITCAVLAGAGLEFLEHESSAPVIIFSWLDPGLIPYEAVLVLDDTPWAQAVHAVKMAEQGVKEGKIQSKFIFKNTKKISRGALRKAQK